jgi:F0F1-type ATP synthase membrane subunit b/b'
MEALLRDRTIEKRVMAVVRNAIESAQRDHDAEIEQADQEHEAEMERIKAAHEAQKLAIADKHVSNVLGKLRA